MGSKSERVRAFFEQPDIYLHYDYNLRIRTEVANAFLEGETLRDVLDMPCGNGMIGISLLPEIDQKLVLVDFSREMIALAKKNTPREYRSKAVCIHDDIYNTGFEENAFDTVISLGIMAHVENPGRFLEYLDHITKPGGNIIIQNTDAAHFYSFLIRLYLGVRKLTGKDKYKLNRVEGGFIEKTFSDKGFELKNTYRYNQSFIGFSRLFSNQRKYRMTRSFFGDPKHNKHASWGSDVIYHFKKK